MNCLICNAETKYYFSKKYTEPPFDHFMKDIGEVFYYQCPFCGFTISKTHCDLDEQRWEKLNFDFHHYLETRSDNETEINQPPYIQQAIMLKILAENEIINLSNSVDYGGGYGTLSILLKKYFDQSISVYDPFMQKEDNGIYLTKEELKKHPTVFNSGLFEHLTTRASFDEINDCVSDDGCMVIHTRISGYIPKDPDWFYLNPPVHCAFHTNKSMEILMEQWGYISSIYCLTGRCWVLLKRENVDVKSKIDLINKELQANYLTYKKGFVDFWKEY
ncbi:MAG: class I SAM-dependent methyltransferase [Bacteroidetes bacterium]|nr:class I SAM-dependent methyltransferase [Bacteroidota bacterium]